MKWILKTKKKILPKLFKVKYKGIYLQIEKNRSQVIYLKSKL